MSRSTLSAGYGVFVDPTKTTSGQRFFTQLVAALGGATRPLEQRPAAVLFNVSAPWREILRAKWRSQKIVLRVDGLYSDRIGEAFLKSMPKPVALLLRLAARWPLLREATADVANFLDSNYSAFFRIWLADWIVYQSQYSREVHRRYFGRKRHAVIVNGSNYVADAHPASEAAEAREIRLVTIYDEWRPSKRTDEVVRFVAWLVEQRKVPATLTVLGYTGRLPESAPAATRELIENRPFVRTLPRFSTLDGATAQALREADCYVCFSYRDSCPNAVVESMAHGLPVLGVASGGLPDIVGDAGRLLPANDFAGGFFAAQRFESEFPALDFDALHALLMEIVAAPSEYRARVRRRFDNDLGMAVVASRYAAVMADVAAAR